MKPRVLIVIPAYNEEKTIATVLAGLRRTVPDYDRVVVTDGSRDATPEIVEALGEKQLRLPCNLGYGRALQTGLKYALARGYDVAVSFDADGQHRPEDVPGLVRTLLESGADVVMGSRYCDGRSYTGPLSRRTGQILFSLLTRLLMGKRVYDTTSGFKAFRAGACDLIVRGTFVDFHTETLVRPSMLGFKIVEAPVVVEERLHGRSMHGLASVVEYPTKTLLLTAVAAADALLARRGR